MATQYDKMVVECDGDADIALALYEAGLSSPGRVKAASDEDVEEVEVPEEYKVGDRKLVYLMKALDLISSRKEGERLITGGGVKLNGETVTDRFALYAHESGAVLQVSKRKVVKLV